MMEKTQIEILKEMQEEGKIDVVYELERILGGEFRSATLEIIKDKDWSDSQKENIMSFKFKGKTILEWEIEANSSIGCDESGNPFWYEPHTNMLDAFTLAKVLFLDETQLK
jgi:hypothetical protein